MCCYARLTLRILRCPSRYGSLTTRQPRSLDLVLRRAFFVFELLAFELQALALYARRRLIRLASLTRLNRELVERVHDASRSSRLGLGHASTHPSLSRTNSGGNDTLQWPVPAAPPTRV